MRNSRKPLKKAASSPRITARQVHPGILKTAREYSQGDDRRLRIISATHVVVDLPR